MRLILPMLLGCKKFLFIIWASLFFCLHVSAQAPANDNCSGAVLLTSSTSCNVVTGTFINATKSASPVGTCGDNNSPDIWYKFVAATANPKIVLSNIDVDLFAKTTYMQLLSGSCPSPANALTCASGSTLSAAGLAIGTTYFIRVTTNTNFASPSTGLYTFDICVQDALPNPLNFIDYSKTFVNISDGNSGGTINQGDILEIRATLVVKNGAGTITNVSFYDTLKRNAGFIFKDSIATRTNEGKNYKTFTNAVGDDAGWKAPTGVDTLIQINIGTGATSATGGSLTNTSRPSLFTTSACIIMATYRVTVDTGVVGYGRKINYGGGAFKYTVGGTTYTISFPRDSLIVYPTLAACSDAVAPSNLIGSANGGNFGTLTNGNNASGTQNGGAASINTTYLYETYSTGPNDYYYGITNNTSKTNATDQTVTKTDASRVFGVWDITGDHTGATNTARGNKPCDPNLPVSTTNPCGYMLTINSSYKSDKVFEYTASGVCSETYYEVSAWFKNLCYKCGCDSVGRGSGNAGYIPTAPGDSSGVRPNIAMQIDGIAYYTTGELKYQGLGGTQTGSDTLNNWVRRSFVFKTGISQTSFKVTFRNNAPGGGGNDWAVDDIQLRTCYPNMIYAPPNPIVFMGSSLTISDTVRSYFNSYTYYKWQKKPFGGSWADVVPASTGIATAVFNPVYGQYEYVKSYTIPGTATLAANAGDLYQMLVATTLANLGNGCVSPSSQSFKILPADAPCAFTDTNYAVTPQTGNIDWNRLDWSLGHVPTCCESAHITYTGTSAVTDAVTVDITNDICIINLTLINNSTKPNQLFKTILHPGYNMQMNGNVRVGAPAVASTDSCVFIAKGGGTITVNGNTLIGYPADNAYSILGSAPATAAYAKYRLRGDSLTYNGRAIANPNFTSITIDPITPATPVKITNNTGGTVANALTFDSLCIGTVINPAKVILLGSNAIAYTNNNFGGVDVKDGSELDCPINAISSLGIKSSMYLRSNAILKLGGSTNGVTGSNFPANFSTYNLDPTSTVIFYGAAQSIPGTVNSVNTYGNITLTGTGIKTGSASTINLAGDLYRKNGGHTYNANSGRVTFTSSINAQKYYADAGATPVDFYDFTNNNTHASGLSIDSTLGVLNELELKPSTKITLNTGNIIMRSTAARTSHVTNLGVTIPSIVYNSTYRFIVERYLFGEKAWRFLATPVNIASSPMVSEAWREGQSALTSTGYGTNITGPNGPFGAASQFDYYTQRGSMKYYNDVANVWTELLTNTTTTPIANKPGYMVYVRGDRGAPNTTAGLGTATNLRIKGKIRTGNQVFNILANKFQSVGNPFASQINFSTLVKSNVTNSFIVWNPLLSGLYGVGGYENYSFVSPDYRLNGQAGGAIRNTIESGEAFFIQNNTASAGTLTVKESDKGILSSLVSRGTNTNIIVPTFDISLYEKNAAGDFIFADGASTSFDNSFSSGLDNDDVIKFTNTNDNLFIKSNNKNLVVERRPIPDVNDTIKLGLTGLRMTEYCLKVDPFVLENINVDAYLVDKYLQTETALSLMDSTKLNFNITSVAESSSPDRFMIIFKPIESSLITSIVANRNDDKTATVNWGIKDEKNISEYTVEHSTNGNNFTEIGIQAALANNGTNVDYTKHDINAVKGKNWYRVKAKNRIGSITYSDVATVNEIIDPLITVYPNPIIEGKINLYFKEQPAGTYTLQVINNIGQVLRTEILKISNNNEVHIINVGTTAKGTYQLKITDNNGVNTTMSVLIK